MDLWAEWALTASALILTVALLRAALGKRLGAGARYALWGLVLIRLLIPAQFIAVPVYERTTEEAPGHEGGYTSDNPSDGEASGEAYTRPWLQQTPGGTDGTGWEPGDTWTPWPGDAQNVDNAGAQEKIPGDTPQAGPDETQKIAPVEPRRVLLGLWLAGAVIVGLTLLGFNLRFALSLRRKRRPLDVRRRLPVYVVDGLSSPCLFGVVRPAVYLEPEAAEDAGMLRHVLAHEETHYRHGDHIWALLRCAALAVHWWNPLVWLAVALSRRDGELYCDQGALKSLGDGERKAYGDTLLALVTANPSASELVSFATTMSGGKRALRERIERIARPAKRRVWALILTLTVAVTAAACAFIKPVETPAGGPDEGEPSGENTPGGTVPGSEDQAGEGGNDAQNPGSPGQADSVDYGIEYPSPDAVPLTAGELRYFNEQYFNGSPGYRYTLRNQFANPLILYASPAEIDLYELFFMDPGVGSPTGEELAALGLTDGSGVFKITADYMDRLLTEYAGLTLAETEGRGLDKFTYLEKSDAWFWRHGDAVAWENHLLEGPSNYAGYLEFLTGTRRGDTVELYQRGPDNGWYCVTLKASETPEGGYVFVSNRRAGHPAVPTLYPEGEPERAISLLNLAPYAPPEVSEDILNILKQVYLPAGSDEVTILDALPDGASATVTAFRDLFGRDGVRVDYFGYTGVGYYQELHDYFTVSDTGGLSLLLRSVAWENQAIDLDGDGADELCDGEGFFFLRDGVLYRADIGTLMDEDAVDWSWFDLSGGWDSLSRSATAVGYSRSDSASIGGKRYERRVFFDGGSLRVYKEEKPWHDHVVDGVREGVPAEVMEAIRDYVLGEVLRENPDGTYSNRRDLPVEELYDDWRIEWATLSYSEQRGDWRLEVYNFNYERHTITPEATLSTLAGGMYVTEDDWASPGYPGCDLLVFRYEGGERTLLWHGMINDLTPGSPEYVSDLHAELERRGI